MTEDFQPEEKTTTVPLVESKAPAQAIGGNKAAFQNKQFRRLFTAWIFGNFGDAVLFLTVAIWVKQMTGSDFHVAMIFVAAGLPAVIAPLLGLLADRFNRKYLMVLNLSGAAAAALILLAVNGPGDMWLVYACIFCYSSSGYITGAAQSGILAGMLPPVQLPAANGLLSSLDQGLRIVAPLIGAGLLAVVGIEIVVWLTVISLLVTAGIFTTLKIEHVPFVSERESFFTSVMAGFAFLNNHGPLRRATITLVACIGATGTLNVLVFTALELGVKKDPELLSLIVAIQGIGAVIAGLLASSIIEKLGYRRTIVAGTLGVGGAIFFLITTSFTLFLVAGAILGFGVTLMIVGYVSYRQAQTPDHLQGRVATAGNMLFNLPQTIMSAVTGMIIASVDYRLLAAVTAVICLLAAIPVLYRGAQQSELPLSSN